MRTEEVVELLMKSGRKINPKARDPTTTLLGIQAGIVDTGCHVYQAGPSTVKRYHLWTARPSHYKIVTTLSSDTVGRPSEQMALRSLSVSVWIAIVLSIVLLSFTLIAMKGVRKKAKATCESFLSFIWYFTSDFLQNAQNFKAGLNGVRFIIGCWMLASGVLTKCYTSNLKWELLVAKKILVDNIQDLADRSDVIPVMWRHARIAESAKNNPGDDYELLRKMTAKYSVKEVFYENFNEALTGTWSGRYANFIDASIIKGNIVFYRVTLKTLRRKAHVGDAEYCQGYSYLFYNKNLSSFILEQVDYLATRYSETEQSRPKKRLDSFKASGYMYRGSQQSSVTKLSLFFLWPVFRIWIVGIAMSIALATVELIAGRDRFFKKTKSNSRLNMAGPF